MSDLPANPSEVSPEIESPAVPEVQSPSHSAEVTTPNDVCDVSRPQAMTPQECAAALKELFPALFATSPPKPVKLRVHADIQARAPGMFTRQVLSAFLHRYTGSTPYLIALTRETQRYDLEGQPAGELTEEHKKVASDELKRRRELRENRMQAELEQRRNRAQLLRDFERTTLTPENFAALKGLTPELLQTIVEHAKQEAAQAPARTSPGGSAGRRDGHHTPRGNHPRAPKTKNDPDQQSED